jgi:ribosomal protein S18 acetylase RimI-like enzyme
VSIRIRRASPADEAAIDHWQRSMQNPDEFFNVDEVQVRDPTSVRKRYNEWLQRPREANVPRGCERFDLVAVEENGAICGYAAVLFGTTDRLTGEPEALVTELHVWPEYRQRGVAKGLLDMAESYAAQRGVPYLSIHVPAASQSTIELMQTAGFAAETTKMSKRVRS